MGWQGARKATNNTGELTAILEGLRAMRRRGMAEVTVRYDSEYAANMTQGKWTM